MDATTGMRDWLQTQDGVTILDDQSPTLIYFSVDHNVLSRNIFIHKCYEYDLLIKSMGPSNKGVKEYKMANTAIADW